MSNPHSIQPPVLLFPGMGSESVGMSAGWEDRAEWAAVLEAAEAHAGQPLRRWMREGPEEELKAQRHSPNATLAHSVGVYRTHRAAGMPRPGVATGYSLGFFSALVAAAVVPLESAMDLVRATEDLADAAFGAGSMGMAFLIGLSEQDARESLQPWPEVELSNRNGSSNFSLSGPVHALENAVAVLAPRCLKAGLLPVRQPLHSRHMRPLLMDLRARMGKVRPRDPEFLLLSMRDGSPLANGPECWDAAIGSVADAVDWPAVGRALQAHPGDWLECGSGRQLAHLTRWLVRDRPVRSLQAPPPPAPRTGLALRVEPH